MKVEVVKQFEDKYVQSEPILVPERVRENFPKLSNLPTMPNSTRNSDFNLESRKEKSLEKYPSKILSNNKAETSSGNFMAKSNNEYR